jgi:hypothetical protein
MKPRRLPYFSAYEEERTELEMAAAHVEIPRDVAGSRRTAIAFLLWLALFWPLGYFLASMHPPPVLMVIYFMLWSIVLVMILYVNSRCRLCKSQMKYIDNKDKNKNGGEVVHRFIVCETCKTFSRESHKVPIA